MTNCFNCKQILCAILSCAAFLWSVPGGGHRILKGKDRSSMPPPGNLWSGQVS